MLTAESRRQSFPSLAGMNYLNTAAEGIPPQEVGAALEAYFQDKLRGMDARDEHFQAWEQTRVLIGHFFGLTTDEVAICSCASEAYNLTALALRLRDGDEVIINDLDFPAGATPWLQPDCPATARLWRSRSGALHVEDLKSLLSPRTRLVTTSLVSFYNGFQVALPELIDCVRRNSSALIAVDVTQALGRVPLNLSDVDLIISSTHKWILGSHGGGLVGVPRRREAELTVPAGGWFNLNDAFGPDRFASAVSKPGASSFMVGMPNFPAIYTIRAALEYLRDVGVEAIDAASRPLVEFCLEELSRLPVELITPRSHANLAGIVAFRHPRCEQLARYLHDRQIHVMYHAGRIRVSIHGYNTQQNVEEFLRALADGLKVC